MYAGHAVFAGFKQSRVSGVNGVDGGNGITQRN
jgi:hypothetical protein